MYNEDQGTYEDLASVFANQLDLERYQEAIDRGASEEEALKVGDNGVGAWGDDTTSQSDPIVALSPDTPGFAYNRKVYVEGPGGSVLARIADKKGHMGKAGIDLNPAAAMAVGHQGGLAPVKWRFADDVSNVSDPMGIALGNGDLSSANLPDVTPTGMMGVPGVHRLTPIGEPGAVELADDTPEGDVTSSDIYQQPSMSDATVHEYGQPIAEPAPPPPSPDGYTYQGMNPDGSKRLTTGDGSNYVDVYPNTSGVPGNSPTKYTIGGKTFFKAGRYAKPVDVSKTTRLVDMVDPKDGKIHLYEESTHDSKDVIDRGISPRDPSLKSKTPESNLTEDGVDYAATQFRITGQMPALGFKNAGDRAKIINAAAEQTKMLNRTPAASIQRQAARKADTASLTKMSTMRDGASAAEQKAIGQTELIAALSDKVPRTQFPILNKAILAGQKDFTGDSNTTQLFNAITTFASEYGKIIEGSTGSVAGASESARSAASKLVNAAMNKETLAGVIGLMKREMALTMNGYDATIASIYGRMDETSGEPGITKPSSPAPSATPSPTPFPPGTPILRSKSTGKYFIKTPQGTVEVDQNGKPVQ